MHLLKFSEAGHIEVGPPKNVTLQSRICRDCLDLYRKNLLLAVGAIQVPAFTSLNMIYYVQAEERACIEEFGQDHVRKFNEANDDVQRRVLEKAGTYFGDLFSKGRSSRTHDLKFINMRLDMVMGCFEPPVDEMLEGILKSACIQTWTAMEVLFEELLVGAVDAYPLIFPGVDRSKLRFRRLGNYKKREGVRFWYQSVLRADTAIDAILSDDSFIALSEIRHVLIHKGGKIDNDFLTRTAGIAALSRYAGHAPGYVIPFDGEMVREIVSPAITRGYDLLVEADRWLYANKTAGTTL